MMNSNSSRARSLAKKRIQQINVLVILMIFLEAYFLSRETENEILHKSYMDHYFLREDKQKSKFFYRSNH